MLEYDLICFEFGELAERDMSEDRTTKYQSNKLNMLFLFFMCFPSIYLNMRNMQVR